VVAVLAEEQLGLGGNRRVGSEGQSQWQGRGHDS